MQKIETPIPGLFLLKPRKYDDERGFFAIPFQQDELQELMPELDFQVKQINHSRSSQNVLRGIHAEPWNKLIYIASGEIFVAEVDLRPGPSFGQVFTATLKEGDGLFVPKGCANSYAVLSSEVNYLYTVDGLWQAGMVYPAVAYNDPELAIDWPVTQPIISEKDQKNGSLAELRASLGL